MRPQPRPRDNAPVHNLLHLPAVMELECHRHHAAPGAPCWRIPLSLRGECRAVCGERAARWLGGRDR